VLATILYEFFRTIEINLPPIHTIVKRTLIKKSIFFKDEHNLLLESSSKDNVDLEMAELALKFKNPLDKNTKFLSNKKHEKLLIRASLLRTYEKTSDKNNISNNDINSINIGKDFKNDNINNIKIHIKDDKKNINNINNINNNKTFNKSNNTINNGKNNINLKDKNNNNSKNIKYTKVNGNNKNINHNNDESNSFTETIITFLKLFGIDENSKIAMKNNQIEEILLHQRNLFSPFIEELHSLLLPSDSFSNEIRNEFLNEWFKELKTPFLDWMNKLITHVLNFKSKLDAAKMLEKKLFNIDF
jgi:hypothetical protein